MSSREEPVGASKIMPEVHWHYRIIERWTLPRITVVVSVAAVAALSSASSRVHQRWLGYNISMVDAT